MSEKSNKKVYNQSGVIPYIYKKNKLKILLITSLSKKNWIIPKGLVEENMSAQESALKEAFEEAGISGQIETDPIGNYSYEKWGGVCKVKVYPCLVKKVYDEWPEQNIRQRSWYFAQSAWDNIQNVELKKIVEKFIAEKS
jgi:8-oxo-dGTP pyrophosphatase MutT (NUDIX family)